MSLRDWSERIALAALDTVDGSERERVAKVIEGELREFVREREGPKPSPRCPKCGSGNVDISYGENGWAVAVCRGCKTARGGDEAVQFFPARAEGDAK